MSENFPFSAILGQEAMQTALLLCAVDPAIGGVLVRGQKGTAKSTAARALASLLPMVTVVAGCPFHCDPDQPDQMHDECRAQHASNSISRELIATPFIDLPLSTTEDRLVGTLHLEETMKSGKRQFQPGLFAAAHRGILYVDEVNLLPDHLVDLLLDTAVSGQNLVEREGLKYSHASRFLLIGTMNPEEGELRPQFLDRFGLCVTIAGVDDIAARREIVLRRLAFDQDPAGFINDFTESDEALRQQVMQARQRLKDVVIPTPTIDRAVAIATAAKVQGHRAELALVRSARALVALLDRDSVTISDLHEVAGFALAHRIPGSTVLSQEAVYAQLTELAAAPLRDAAFDQDPGQSDDQINLLENTDFPGAAAAGSSLLTYLKKKMKTASSVPTNPST